MDDILDEIITANTNQTYSWISVICGSISIVCFVFILSRLSPLGEYPTYSSLIVFIIFIISALIGVLATLISYVRKEPYNWQRQLGAVLNLFLVAIVLGAISFYFFIGEQH